MDDNVHLQNSIQLIHELQRAGKDSFELMLYPRSRHGVGSPHRPRMRWRAIRDNFNLPPER
jgi:dipeptidyl aminopeptidase/acylaminoacyl peptidase